MKKRFLLILSTALIFSIMSGCSGNMKQKQGEETMNMKRTLFGEANSRQIYQYTFTNAGGMSVSIINYGGIVTHLMVPDREGNPGDVVLGYDSLSVYLENNSPYFGAITGRYANRIARGKFILDDVEYQLATNNGLNHLHGGIKGLDKVVWEVKDFIFPDSAGVILTYLSKDGEEGYPGNLNITVTYTLTNKNELKIDYEAVTDKPTVLNLTHHSYFNLAGHSSGTVYNHQLLINADKYIPVDETLIPTGELLPVEGTPMDFRVFNAIGDRIGDVDGGYDHTFVLNGYDGKMRFAAHAKEPVSGRSMKVFTDQPGMQFYSGNFLDGTNIGKGNTAYQKHFGFCLETQHFPDSPNQPAFPSTVLRPGEKYQTSTIYWFGVE